MACIYLKKRKNKPFCKKLNVNIEFSECSDCKYKEYKPIKVYKLKQNKPIKQRTYKQSKAEKNRFSILTNDLERCIVCGKANVNLHEVFFGRAKRHLSIKYGLVIPLCKEEHHNQIANKGIHFDKGLDTKWKQQAQLSFMKHYNKTKDEFIEIFGRNYLD